MKPLSAIIILWGLVITAAHGSVPQTFRAQYNSLQVLEPVRLVDGSVGLGEARRFDRHGIRVLYVKGDSFEMAYQHGRLLRDDIRQGALPQTATIVRNSVINSFPLPPMLINPAMKVISRLYGGQMAHFAAEQLQMPLDQYLADAYGMAAGAGLDVEQVLRALTGPETLQVLLGEQASGGSALPAPLSVKSCTDFVAKSNHGQGFIIGRNTDYPLNGTFDRFPTVVYYHPTDGDQKFMSVTSAGLHTAGVVGMNESGIYLGIHTIPTHEVSKRGFPAFSIGELVLRKAKSFDEAIKLFSTTKPAAGWAYTLVSLKEGRMGSVEFNNQKMAIRESQTGWHIQTNHYLTDELRRSNLDLNATINADTEARFLRVKDLLTQNHFELDAESAVGILSDKVDPFSGKTRGLGNVIAVHTTLSSAVIDSAARKIFVASGRAPVSTTPFVELPLLEDFNPETFGSAGFQIIQQSSYHSDHPELSRAEQLYIEAKHAYESELNPNKAARILGQAVTVDPDNPGYRFVLGLMYIKAGRFHDAEALFLDGAQMFDGHYQLASQYFLARLYAHRGERAAARELLQRVLKDGSRTTEAPLLRASEGVLQKLHVRSRVRFNHRTLAVFMPEADVVLY